jgi:CheY-like chemotaxis protein
LPQGNGEIILVADDEESIRDITQSVLESGGYKVLLAADGKEAVDAFAGHSSEIALVLTDMVMPNVDGISAVHAIREIRPDIKVIAVTAYIDNVRYVDLLGDVDAVIRKPYSMETLLNTVALILAESPRAKGTP